MAPSIAIDLRSIIVVKSNLNDLSILGYLINWRIVEEKDENGERVGDEAISREIGLS